MSESTILALVTAVFSVFGVKLLDYLAGGRTESNSTLGKVAASQETRIKNLEDKLEAKDKEFDAYRDEQNREMNKLRDELREVRAENRELKSELARYKDRRDA